MADRIEYQGDSLPTGLPGFGGASIQTLTLPGFNTVVAPLKFGPVVDAVDVVPPSPTPPTGSNPNSPTDQVVAPGPVPPPIGVGIPFIPPTFCKQCETPPFLPDIQPLFYGSKEQDICIDCSREEVPIDYYAPKQTINSDTEFVYYNAPGAIGYTGPNETEWYLDKNGIIGKNDFSAWGLTIEGVTTLDADGVENLFSPMKLDICENGETKTIHILAYRQP